MIFKTKRHETRKFNYTPRYYDKKGEEMKREKIKNGEDSNIDFRDRLRVTLQEKKTLQQKPITRILALIVLLGLLLYFMLT